MIPYQYSAVAVPNLFVTRDHFRGRQFFRMIRVCYIYCGLYLFYYHISSTLDHQALDSGDW